MLGSGFDRLRLMTLVVAVVLLVVVVVVAVASNHCGGQD